MKKGLALENMTFFFPQTRQPFFKDLSLKCPAGKLHFIQGKNGSGKSTLLRILQGTIMPGELLTGQFSLNSESITIAHNTIPTRFTQKIKTVVQDTDDMLADQFTVEQNLQCAQLPPYPGLSSLPSSLELPLLLHEFGIDKRQQVAQLSGGQRQLLALVMALQKPTAVLLLDEPTAALDPKNASMVMDFLHRLVDKKDLTVLIISHDKELVDTYCSGTHFELHQEDTGIRTLHIIKSSSGDQTAT